MNEHAAEFPHEFIIECLALIAQHVPGETTLNQLRILHYIDMRTAQPKGHTSHTEICTTLDMPAATVTRAVASFIEAGIVTEREDEWDARRRLVMVSEHWAQGNTLDQTIIELARRYFRK